MSQALTIRQLKDWLSQFDDDSPVRLLRHGHHVIAYDTPQRPMVCALEWEKRKHQGLTKRPEEYT